MSSLPRIKTQDLQLTPKYILYRHKERERERHVEVRWCDVYSTLKCLHLDLIR